MQKLPVRIIEHLPVRQLRIIYPQIVVHGLIRIEKIHDRTVGLKERLQTLAGSLHILLHILITFFLQDPARLYVIVRRHKDHGQYGKDHIDHRHFLKKALIFKPFYDIHSVSPRNASRKSD